MSRAEELLQLMAVAPVGLVDADVDGEVRAINQVAEAALATIGGRREVGNVFDCLEAALPSLREAVDGHVGPGLIVDRVRLVVRPSAEREQVFALSVHRFSSGAIGVVLDDLTGEERREQRLQLRATEDDLTGASNRSAFEEIFDVEVVRAQRYGRAMSLALIDIDDFRQVNATFGYGVGDAILRELAHRLRRCVRKPDHLARMGGEEFGLLLPETTRLNAVVAANRARKVVAVDPFETEAGPLDITISVGVAERPAELEDFALLCRAAERAMARAARSGGDCVACAGGEDFKQGGGVP